jgi:hypothetical protein
MGETGVFIGHPYLLFKERDTGVPIIGGPPKRGLSIIRETCPVRSRLLFAVAVLTALHLLTGLACLCRKMGVFGGGGSA